MTRAHLLWIDCLAALLAGTATLLLGERLAAWYGLPPELLRLIGAVNLLYAGYAFTLAIRNRRPLGLILLLVGANAAWALVCLGLAWRFGPQASLLGLGHLLGEALFVGGLAGLEWRWRRLLMYRQTPPLAPRDQGPVQSRSLDRSTLR